MTGSVSLVGAWIPFGMPGCRCLIFATRIGGWKFAGRIDYTEKQICNGVAVLRALVPSLENGRNGVDPGHEHRIAVFENHDGPGIDGRHLGDQPVLIIDHVHVWLVVTLGRN